MKEEAESLFKTLHWTCGMVLQSGQEDRERIAACFERSDTYRAADDIACVGWILTAMQERVNERDLPNWRQFRKIIKTAVDLLPLPTPTMH